MNGWTYTGIAGKMDIEMEGINMNGFKLEIRDKKEKEYVGK